MSKIFAVGLMIVLILAATLMQFSADPLAAQDSPTPTMPVPIPTLAPNSITAAIAADYPRVDGSTSALPLNRLIACKIIGVSCIWLRDWSDGTMSIYPFDADMESGGTGEQIVNITASGTHDAYMNLIAGNTDLILVARALSPDEIAAAEEAGVTLDVRPVAWDAFVFLLNVENPRDNFTLDEIRAIYTGQITTWTDLGVDKALSEEAGNPIRAFIRDPNSGSQELMDDLVMHGTPMIDAPDMMIMTMMGLISAVEWDTAGIGYSVYYYTVFMAPGENIKLVGIEGVLPTSATIADGSYPLTAEVYVVTRADMPEDSTAVLLRDWLLSEEGQAVVAESGYVPIREP